jgi:hypothetical protein
VGVGVGVGVGVPPDINGLRLGPNP